MSARYAVIGGGAWGTAIAQVEASGFSLTLQDEAPIRGRAGCSRFVARAVRGIDPQRPTPAWMASMQVSTMCRSTRCS